MTNKTKIAEIFDSIQGEGSYIGYRQLFIRFCGCNLLCDYCDTEFDKGEQYSVESLLEKVKTFNLQAMHSVSLTGGEPLLHYEFLREFLPELKKLNLKIYLETNGTLTTPLVSVINYIDFFYMDFNLDSSAKIGDVYAMHDEFLNIAEQNQKDTFAKLVFDDNIKDYELNECLSLAKKYNIQIILQPKMDKNTIKVSHEKIMETFNYCSENYHQTRLIGQVHKFFDIR